MSSSQPKRSHRSKSNRSGTPSVSHDEESHSPDPVATGNPESTLKTEIRNLLTNDADLKKSISEAIAKTITDHLLTSPLVVDEIAGNIINNVDFISAISAKVQEKVASGVHKAMSHDNTLTSAKVSSIEADQKSMFKEYTKLENKFDELEQYSRRNCLLIHGIPENESEDTTKVAIDTFAKLDVTVTTGHIDRSHRLGRKTTNASTDKKMRPRPVIVKFTSYLQRSMVYRNKRKLKNSGKSITENLTVKRLQLLREASDNVSVQAAWSTDGRITCLLTNDKRVTITNRSDLLKLEI